MVVFCYESGCLKWQNWEQRQPYVKCSDRGMSEHGEMRCLTGSAEAQWVKKPKWGVGELGLRAALAVFVLQKPASWTQNCICLLPRNASSNQVTGYQSQNLESRKSLWPPSGAPCPTAMLWEAIATSSCGNTSKATQTGTSMSPAALMDGFLPPVRGKSRHEEPTVTPETLLLYPVAELK